MQLALNSRSINRPWNALRLLICLSMLLALNYPAPQLPAVIAPASSLPLQTDSFLQFKTTGHIMGFSNQRVSLASLDHALSLEFVGTNGATPETSTPVSAGYVAPALQEVTYTSLWRGINAVFGVQAGAVAKSTYHVAPGADPSQIKLRYNVTPALQPDGSLQFAFENGQMTETPPLAWQMIAGRQVDVPVGFALDRQGLVGFGLGQFDPAYTLVIDPAYQWHTFYGGAPVFQLTGACPYNGSIAYLVGYGNPALSSQHLAPTGSAYAAGGNEITVVSLDAGGYPRKVAYFGSNSDDRASGMVCVDPDASSQTNGVNIYVVGSSAITWLGPLDQAPLHAHSGYNDITVISLSGASTTSSDISYNWHTFWGSDDNDYGQDIAFNGTDLIVAGYSYSSWLGASNASPLHAYNGGADIVALKMSTSGSLAWHTFYGSQEDDTATGVSIGKSAQVWVSATSDATWKGPLTANNPKHSHSGFTDMAVLVLSSAGAYTWHTFYGSSGGDVARAVVTNQMSGDGFIVGYSNMNWRGDGSTAPLHAFTSGNEIAVLALSNVGAYIWHTFYGGSDSDEGCGITMDSNGNLYIAATSGASWTGPTGQVALDPYAGGNDIALLKLQGSGATGGAYTWHTFYGSAAADIANDVIYHDGPWLVGFSDGAWNGSSGEAPKESFVDSRSGVFVKTNSSGAYFQHFFLGSSQDDSADSISTDASGNFILIGNSCANWFGPTGQAPLHSFSGGSSDLFVLKLSPTGGYIWHTFYGGPSWDNVYDVATDSSDNIYVTGMILEPWDGPSGQAPRHAYNAGYDIFVLKLNSAGAYQWHTFWGSASMDEGWGIAVSSTGVTYITGYSSQTWTGTGATPPKHAHSGGKDLLVVALTPSGDYGWHTFYGSSSDENGWALVEKGGYLYITGYGSTWTGSTGQAPLHAHDGTISNLSVLKLSTAGNYVWHTFYGSEAYGRDIAIDSSSNLYVVAANKLDWNGPAGQSPTHPYAQFAAVVLKLDSSGGYVWHGFFGSKNNSMASAIALDAKGNVWVALHGEDEWKAYGTIAPINPHGDGREGWLLQLNSSGSYKHHTYFGGIGQDENAGVAVNPTGLVAVAGHSHSTWNYRASTNPLHAFKKVTEVYVVTFLPFKEVFLPIVIR